MKECERCGASFGPDNGGSWSPKRLREQRFCSHRCSALSRPRRALRAERVCGGCGSVYERQAHRVGRFCSRKCSQLAQRGEGSASWSGGRRVDRKGYVHVYLSPDDPLSAMAQTNYRVLEHRIVMARALGRPLERFETVHHRNGDRSDNRLANLELWIENHSAGQRVEDAVAWAHEILRRYEEGASPLVQEIFGGQAAI